MAVFQGVVLSFIIIFRRPAGKSNLFFGSLVFLFSLSLLHLILEESISAFNAKFPVPMEFSLTYGPLAYLHVMYIKDPKRTFRKKDLFHFLPSLVLDGIFFTAFFLYIRSHMEWAYANILTIQSIALAISYLGAAQLSIYTYFIYKESVEAKRVLKEFQNIKRWLNFLIGSWSLIIGFLVLAIPIGLIFIEDLDGNSFLLYKPLGILVCLWIYFLGYMYLLKYAPVIEVYAARIAKFSFSEHELDDRKNHLLIALKEEKLYQDSSLTIAKLANHLNWPINSLSILINESLHTNFNDLINQHRVMAFKERILQPDSHKYSIMGLGQEVGFRSKASFYRAFKKETGITPTQFIKSQA
ncbi:helix-turn-helix domain-containing protein [Fulvivirga ligni]|uniref:helix-turn-helix domain-containing protein n=1 Tax=Fulvivirga ligni TaxID=2904246 RepID=UPI001F26F030|nr:helix-turn-helix domain-containing protein [Fulvivirga ligni]UII20479.1 helix-turn-helix domain-containing protein [Fulvivirga ligni]